MKLFSFLKPAFNFFLIGLLITTISRFTLFLIFHERVAETVDYGYIFPIGLRMDVILLSYILLLPVLLLVFLPNSWLDKIRRFFTIYFILFLTVILLMELATPDFIMQYDTRPNKLFIDYLIYPKEVADMLFKSYLWSILTSLAIICSFVYVLFRFRQRLFGLAIAPYRTKLLVFPLVGFLLFFGARSSLTSRRPINASNAVFSTDQLTNSLAVNSTYTVAFAAYSLKHENSSEKMYGKMKYDEALARVKKYMNVSPENYTEIEQPMLHIQKADTIIERPYNIVILLEESLGAEYVGSLGGLPLTAEFDKLTSEGLLFTNLYATGTRSVRGIEAVVTGFLPSPSESVVKLSNSQSDFFTVASLLKEKGYDTSFIYGGMANFDNMGSFFNGNGFDTIIDEDDFDPKTSAFHATWGWSDEDLVAKANSYFKSLGSKPFVSLVFSSSNHEPFEIPENRIVPYDKKKYTVHNAMKYADFSIGKFFELAKKEAYYKNTIFIIIADHNTRTYGKHLVPVHKFHIPALIIGPGFPEGKRYDKLCSQIDILPTVLSRVGFDMITPMPGRNLFKLPANIPGRSIMQFHDINAFRVGDNIIILQPNKKALQFHISNDTVFSAMNVDKQLAKDALAHVVAASYLYKHRKYRLKN